MDNEENRSLTNKKAFEDQWASLGQFSFGALSLFSLSLSHTLIYLEFSWSTIGKEGNRKQRSCKERQDQATTISFITYINFHVYFPCYISHAWDCKCFFFLLRNGFSQV